ncbi:MAG: multiple sugar transport system permease protein [Candidatus Sumerlaeota bacterium]|nr:multiple sugar transport system permease protein [Candidatus Sumerlaeota bacterium]
MPAHQAVAPQPVPGRRRGSLARTERFWGLLLSSPYILGLLFFAAGPILFSWIIGFFEWDSLTPPRFVALANWQRLFTDPLFHKALFNTLYFVLGSVPPGVLLSLLLAMAVNRGIKGITIFRTIYFTPVVTSVVAVALVWTWIYDTNVGILNLLIERTFKLFGARPPEPIAWLNDPRFAMPAIIAMSIWKGLGYNMVIFLAALQDVPTQLYEAAELDGAGRLGKFRHVTLPMISPVTFFVLAVSLIGAFQVFDQIYIMAKDGRPANSTLTIVYHLYNHAFRYLEMGYASTIGAALFLMIFAVTLFQLWAQKRWVHYQ